MKRLFIIVVAIAVGMLVWNEIAKAAECREIAPHQFDCTDPNLLIPKNQTWYVKVETIEVVTSKCTPTETCPGGNYHKCRNAVGKIPQKGISVACPRAIKFGTRIILRSLDGTRSKSDEHVYTCDDRTSSRRGIEGRFDIFETDYNKAKVYGLQKKKVTIEYALPVPRMR